ncbi:alpha/beta-hydrolase [Xylariaceae sp. FL1019]|nr:alpha/beta-hydrolase [Xylariaceae sp. FL1019]
MESAAQCLTAPVESATSAAIATTAVATLGLLWMARRALWPQQQQIIKGALTTSIPKLSNDEIAQISYPPDYFPGARDVFTPYGTIRVYEFGPEDGKKVLLIHGISTSCMTLGDVTNALVEKGCRVMLFDLFGRGYSDAPGDLPYDTRLFVSQILLVLASSPLAWTGTNGLRIIGYSLGGAIAANFAATFPEMVESLILLAPAGVIRHENIGRASRLIFTSGLVPERILAWLTKSRLRSPIANAIKKKPQKVLSPIEDKEDFVDVAVQEATETSTDAPTAFELEVTRFVHWSLDFNPGYVPAMMSTIRHAPLMDQQPYWRKLRQRKLGTTAVIVGRKDTLVQHEDYEEDVLPMLGGRDSVFWRMIDEGGHNFPFTHPRQTLELIYEFWNIE